MIEYDYQAVRAAIIRDLPDALPEIEWFETEDWALLPGEDGWTDLLFDRVLWDYLEDATRRQDQAALRRGADLVETLMRDGDPEVRNLAIIGVVKPLARTPALRDAFLSFGLRDIVVVGDQYNAVGRELLRRPFFRRWWKD